MSSGTHLRATLDDLLKEEGKAELIDGRIVPLMPTGRPPNRVAGRIFWSLDDHADATDRGEAYTDNMGFAAAELSPARGSFSPDASYDAGPLPADEMRFIIGTPALAVEVRSESDYGDAAEAEMAARRADDFEAGTAVVWDVDPVARCVHVDRPDAPDHPASFRQGQVADAEPAVPGWRMAVDRMFP